MSQPHLSPLRMGEKLLQQHALSRAQLRKALELQRSRRRRLGELLQHLGYVPPKLVESCLQAECASPSGLRLGELLVAKGWLSPGQLDQALAQQRETEEALGSILLQRAWLDPHQLELALTEILLRQGTCRKRRLGAILAQTRQISAWQLKEALRRRQPQERLGQTLLRLDWLNPQQLGQALRLQKRLWRSAMGLFLGASLLVGCKAPTVPLQFPDAGNMNRLVTQSQRPMTALSGPFKTLAVEADSEHQIKIRIYQNGARIIENVPYFTQGNDNTCGQAVVAMLTNFWGVATNYQALVDQENPLNLATTAGALVRSLRQKGLATQDFRDASLDNLVAEINKGRPTAVLLDFGSIQQAHYVVIVGYNPQRSTLIMHDSLESPYVEMPTQTFVKMWENRSIRSILPAGGDNYRRLMVSSYHAAPAVLR